MKRSRRMAVLLLVAGALVLGACAGDPEPVEPRDEGSARSTIEPVARTPAEGYLEVDPELLERERNDRTWLTSAERDRTTRRAERERRPLSTPGDPTAATTPGTTPVPPVDRLREPAGMAVPATPSDPTRDESIDELAPEALRGEPRLPVSGGEGPSVFRTQWLLDHARFSPGVIDGRWGKNTEKAVYWLQDALGLETTGALDAELHARLSRLVVGREPVRRYRVTQDDVDGPFVSIPEEALARADLSCLCYESASEKLAEDFHTTRDTLERLNPGADLADLAAGDELWVPDVDPVSRRVDDLDVAVRELVVSKQGFYLHALDADGDVVYHFPVTVGAGYDPSPTGELSVTAFAWDPTFHYQPELFDEVPDTRPDAILPPGPNSPVGVLWMQLSRENYGIHGTAAPETIGYATSHGCVRLTNWDATFLGSRLEAGTPVVFR